MTVGKMVIIGLVILLAFAFFRQPTEFKEDPWRSFKEATGDIIDKGKSLLPEPNQDQPSPQQSAQNQSADTQKNYVGGIFKLIEGNCLSDTECNSLNPDCDGQCLCDGGTGQCYMQS